MTDGATFLAVWIALWGIARTELSKGNMTAAKVLAGRFWTACSLNFEAESLSSEAMFVALVGTNVATLWAALIADDNETVVILFAHVSGFDTHPVKPALLVDASRTIEDAIRNVFHLIGAAYEQKIFASQTSFQLVKNMLLSHISIGKWGTEFGLRLIEKFVLH